MDVFENERFAQAFHLASARQKGRATGSEWPPAGVFAKRASAGLLTCRGEA
jgi:hypothetical protein